MAMHNELLKHLLPISSPDLVEMTCGVSTVKTYINVKAVKTQHQTLGLSAMLHFHLDHYKTMPQINN